mmetsp:Transcript_25886/g.41658  ORF Transcript_25886/g.41658 Transcript_25886/m.41658 type:complete len:132 (-) Transcript_25886:414-809(-)
MEREMKEQKLTDKMHDDDENKGEIGTHSSEPTSPTAQGVSLDPSTTNPLQERYQWWSNFWFIYFWCVLFAMTNFIFFYFSLKDFRIDRAVWFVAVTVFVIALAVSHLLHSLFDCMSNTVVPAVGQQESTVV